MRGAPHRVMIGLALVAAASTIACATYHPRASRFISLDADGIYHRDGQRFDIGMFGGSAQSLVGGDPRAFEYVRRYKHLTHVGLPCYVAGLATMLVAPFLLAPAVPERAQTPATIGAIGLGAALASVGIALIFKGNAALVDAVNVYNDDLAEPPPMGRP